MLPSRRHPRLGAGLGDGALPGRRAGWGRFSHCAGERAGWPGRALPNEGYRCVVSPCPEPPMRIVSSNEDAAHRYLAAERVVLACELSRADVPVQWYKDGVEVEEGESLILERQGPHRRLVIPLARPQDTGEFVCDAGGDSVFYNITVTGR
uniref:Ig-like domain-containing protein n=1 Tax=Pelusios castaneus TaxID=367368 RepID=A0A8C8SJD8_9SAUR